MTIYMESNTEGRSHESIYKTDTKKETKVQKRQIVLLQSWKSDNEIGRKVQYCYCDIGKSNNMVKHQKLFYIFGAPIIFSSTVY